MKISYFTAITNVSKPRCKRHILTSQCILLHELMVMFFQLLCQLHMGKQSEEQQKFGEAVSYHCLFVWLVTDATDRLWIIEHYVGS